MACQLRRRARADASRASERGVQMLEWGIAAVAGSWVLTRGCGCGVDGSVKGEIGGGRGVLGAAAGVGAEEARWGVLAGIDGGGEGVSEREVREVCDILVKLGSRLTFVKAVVDGENKGKVLEGQICLASKANWGRVKPNEKRRTMTVVTVIRR